MKRLQWILSTMLIISMLISCMPGASALTAEEWNAQCTVKTVKNTIVYRPDAAGNKTQVATIPEGTFVQQNAFDSASQMWNITFLTSNGATAWGLVSASSLAVTSVSVTLDDGTEVEVPEELSSDPDAAAAYLNQTRTDHYYTVNSTDGTIHAGDISEKPQTDTTKMEVPEGYEAAAVEDTFGGQESTATSESADTQTEAATETAVATTQADTTASQTDVQATQTESATNSTISDGEKIDYHRVIMMGSSKTLVNINGAQQTVDTSLIDFGTEVPYEEQLATINAPKTGKCALLAEPKKGAAKLGTLKHGTIVGVIRKGKTYTRIFANGMEGVVTNASVKTLTRGESSIGNGVLTYNGQIDNSKQINIRVKASTSAKVFDHWNCGTEVTIFGKSHSFYEIEANGIRAFVNEKFLTEGSKENIPVKTTTKKKNSGGSSKKKSNGSSSPSTPPATTTTTNTTTPTTTTNTTTPTTTTNTTTPTTTTNTTTPTTTTNTTTPTTTTTTENSAPGSTTSTTTPNNSPTDATRAATENTQTNTPTTSENALPGQVTNNYAISDKPSTSGASGTQTAPGTNSEAATPTSNSTPPSNDQSTAVGKLPASEGSGNPVGGPASAVGTTSTASDPDRGYTTDPKAGATNKTDTPGSSSQSGASNTAPGATGFDTP